MEEGSSKVPGYIVTYSDMVTLLLTFFVMLLSLATVQDPELFYLGRGSFIQSIQEMGMGMLFGRKPHADFGNQHVKYRVENPDQQSGRTIDAKQEQLRRTFQKLSRFAQTMPSQIVAQRSRFSIANARFSAGQSDLSRSAKQSLRGFCTQLKSTHEGKPGIIYVLGLANEPAIEKEQWILSARRAREVAHLMRSALNSGADAGIAGSDVDSMDRWQVYWWGAGPGGHWVGRDSPISNKAQILIAVLEQGD
jgi:flagellar motor protein MotB